MKRIAGERSANAGHRRDRRPSPTSLKPALTSLDHLRRACDEGSLAAYHPVDFDSEPRERRVTECGGGVRRTDLLRYLCGVDVRISPKDSPQDAHACLGH